ncbi:nitrate reductase molybdenum cofactor assembly chaperone [Paenibacillus sp. CMAA1364]
MKDVTLRSSWMMMSFLLQYPDIAWQESADEMFVDWCHLLEEDDAANIEIIRNLANDCITEFVGMDSQTITQNYVRTFDFSKKSNLYLTYGQLGEERERGPALLKLKQVYEEEDMLLTSEELPDYLPLVLEYVAVAEGDKGISLLISFRKALETVQAALVAEDSPYRHALTCILTLLDQSAVKEGSFEFDASTAYVGNEAGAAAGCGPMWAAAGYGGGSPHANQEVNRVDRGKL